MAKATVLGAGFVSVALLLLNIFITGKHLC